MLKHNLVLIYRNLKRNKATFFINLIGLSLGLVCVFLIYFWVSNKLSYDKYHKNDRRLYQILTNNINEKGIETGKETPHLLSEVLRNEMPEVELVTTTTPELFFPNFTLSFEEKKIKGVGKFVSKDFFKVFSYQLTQGDQSHVLNSKSSIVLSESTAKKIFNATEDVIGKTIDWDVSGIQRKCIVTGIFKNIPLNSSEYFDFVLSFDDLKDIMQMESNWNSEPFCTYLVIGNAVDVQKFSNKLNTFLKSNINDKNRSYFLQQYSDNYLYNRFENGKVAGGRIEFVRLFSAIALFIIVISSINFMNLSTAKASGRIKEIGIKKAIGAQRRVLIFQYLGESLIMSFLSLVAAVFLVFLLLPSFEEITQQVGQFHFDSKICIAVIVITFFTGVLSGSYPALYLSGFKPALILKGKFSNSISEQITRKGLVIFQFCLSIIFIVSVLVLYKQIKYVQDKNLGFDRNNVIYFESNAEAAVVNELRSIPGVTKVSNMLGTLIGDKFGGQGNIDYNGKKIPVHSFGVNYEMIETLGIKVLQGRTFNKNFGSNKSEIVINEAAVDAMGLKEPVGTVLKNQGQTIEIIGVVKNFNFQSLHEKIIPIKFRLESAGASTIVVKMDAGKEKEVLNYIQNVYKKYNTGTPFEYKSLDQDYQALYSSEKQVSILSRYFAGLSIIISCLGLYGLSAYTAEARVKEIGIRKVLGSSVLSIVMLLSSEFSKMILISISISLPLSYFLAKNWLDNFSYKISLELWYFYGSGLLTIIIALITVSFQSYKAAIVDPIKSLHS